MIIPQHLSQGVQGPEGEPGLTGKRGPSGRPGKRGKQVREDTVRMMLTLTASLNPEWCSVLQR